jgi:hypothetical protein
VEDAFLFQFSDDGVCAAVIFIVGLFGSAMLAREARADELASIEIANWIWDAERVEEFARWNRAEAERLHESGASSEIDGQQRLNSAQVSDHDLLVFDKLQLQQLLARQIDLILRGKRIDPRLLEETKEIEASIDRRRWRIANNQRVPGVPLAPHARHSSSDNPGPSSDSSVESTSGSACRSVAATKRCSS